MATRKGKKPLSETDRNLKGIKEAIEKHRRNARKEETFTSLTEEQARKKLERVNSPMITSQGWSGGSPGGAAHYSVGIYNPDPVTYHHLFVHVFFGSGHAVPDPGTYLLNVDARWPRLTEVPQTGFSLDPSASTILYFSIKIPAGIEPSGYIGNSVLYVAEWHDVGTYLDRATFVVKVS